MKKIMFISLLAAILFSSTACKKDKEETQASNVSVKFDGITWTADYSVAVFNSTGNETGIVASSGLSSQMQIFFRGNSTGTFNFKSDFEGSYCIFIMNKHFYSSVSADGPSGQIIVTKYDKEKKLISGTFHFKGIDFEDETKIFTEGVFTNVKLENQ